MHVLSYYNLINIESFYLIRGYLIHVAHKSLVRLGTFVSNMNIFI